MGLFHRSPRLVTAAVMVMTCGLSSDGAGYRNFKLPCLAPLLEQVDAEAPATLGLAFLEGPTRAPVPRDAIGTVDFPITTGSPEAAAHFNQGVAFLHGLANAEAERSFRRALTLDPDHPMVLWGLAVANEQRPQRARLFAQNALRRLRNETTARERLWIDTLARFHNVRRDGPAKLPPPETLTGDERRARHRRRIRDLEGIVMRFPDDIEARAFLLRRLALDKHRHGLPITSHVAVDQLGRDLAKRAPNHPSRHYRIFLWLGERPREALAPAETSASLAPGIADSWRYAAEAWRANGLHAQAVPLLEAALRVDHARMRAELLMPGDVANLVSNYAALVETLAGMGRVNEALAWSRRMLTLPRTLRDRKETVDPFAMAGKRLHAEVLLRAELFERLLGDLERDALFQPDPGSAPDRARWLYRKGVALAALGRHDEIAPLETELATIAANPPTPLAREELDGLLAGLKAFRALRGGQPPADPAVRPPEVPLALLARSWAAAGDDKEALNLARENLAARPGEVLAVAAHCETSLAAGEAITAMAAFDRTFREKAMRADAGLPVLARLAPVAARMQLPKRWMLPAPKRATPGAPAAPDSLGPLEWTPAAAPAWSLPDHTGRTVSLGDFTGKAVLLNFFLGVECPYCVAQLNRFRPTLGAFEEAGISMIAISIDPVEKLAARLGTTAEKTPEARRTFPYPVLADPDLTVFKAYRVFDEFEAGPMHATILIDPGGRILWSDVSHGPFNHPEALLAEAQRLLHAPQAPQSR